MKAANATIRKKRSLTNYYTTMNAYYRAEFEQLIQWVSTNDNRSIVVKQHGERISIDLNNFKYNVHPDGCSITLITPQEFNEQVLRANLRIAKALTE